MSCLVCGFDYLDFSLVSAMATVCKLRDELRGQTARMLGYELLALTIIFSGGSSTVIAVTVIVHITSMQQQIVKITRTTVLRLTLQHELSSPIVNRELSEWKI